VLRNSSAGSQDFAVRHDIPFVSRCGDGVGLQDPHAFAVVSGHLDRGRDAISGGRPRRSVVALANVISVQFSYLAGIFVRRTLEQTGYSLPPVIPRPR